MAHNFILETPLGTEMLVATSFSGTEEMSRLYSYIIETKSTLPAIPFADIVGTRVTLSLSLADEAFSAVTGKKRYICGHVKRFSQPSRFTDCSQYHLEIVPWLWFLTQRSDCRIFQDKTAVDIMAAVFDGAGFSGKYEFKTKATYRKREYCVQYRETNFHFVSRLMEEEGIAYFFTHDKKEHKLVLVDEPNAHKPVPPDGKVPYCLSSEVDQRQQAVIDFIADHSVRPTKVTLRDFDFIKPGSDLTVEQKAADTYEVYDFPGRYAERSDGEHYAKVQLEREQSECSVFSGTATDYRLSAGSVFTLTEHPRVDYNASYLLTSVHLAGSQMDDESHITCSFECIPADVQFRPRCLAAKPFIAGCQTAIVVGPSDEELWLDKYGRIKVQFHWDRLGKKDEHSSCWIRVARSWAGKNWGFVFNPRIGQEVIVQFIEGDIDRPIVTGSVYNEEQMPPYELPTNATQSTIKSRSSKGGTPDNFNEIKFEDKKGEEQFLIHAEKDHTVTVENNESHSVGSDESHTVGHDETHTVGNNRTTTIEKDDTLTVKQNRTIEITKNCTKTVEKDETVTIKGNRTHTTEKDYKVTTRKNETRTIDENLKEIVKKDAVLLVNENRNHQIGKKETMSVGKEWKIDVGDKVEIICGQASITLKKDGTIELKGKDIKTTGTGKIDITATADVTVQGSKVALN